MLHFFVCDTGFVITIITILLIRERTQRGNLTKVIYRTSAISLLTPELIQDRSRHLLWEREVP